MAESPDESPESNVLKPKMPASKGNKFEIDLELEDSILFAKSILPEDVDRYLFSDIEVPTEKVIEIKKKF